MDSRTRADNLLGMGRLVFLAILVVIVAFEHIRRPSRRDSRLALVIRFGQVHPADRFEAPRDVLARQRQHPLLVWRGLGALVTADR